MVSDHVVDCVGPELGTTPDGPAVTADFSCEDAFGVAECRCKVGTESKTSIGDNTAIVMVTVNESGTSDEWYTVAEVC